MAQRSAALALLACGLTLAACGSDAEDLFGNTTVDGADNGSGATAGSGATGSGASGGSDTGATGSGASGNQTSAGGAGNAGPGGSANGGAPTTSTGGSPTTSSGGSTGDSLDCGNVDCPVARDSACCWDEYEQNAPPQAECVSTLTDSCNNTISSSGLETIIECQVPSHCKTGVCCGERDFFQSGGQSMSFYSEVTCRDSCDWPDIVMCDPQAPVCPDAIVMGQPTPTTCEQSQLLPPGYFVCAT